MATALQRRYNANDGALYAMDDPGVYGDPWNAPQQYDSMPGDPIAPPWPPGPPPPPPAAPAQMAPGGGAPPQLPPATSTAPWTGADQSMMAAPPPNPQVALPGGGAPPGPDLSNLPPADIDGSGDPDNNQPPAGGAFAQAANPSESSRVRDALNKLGPPPARPHDNFFQTLAKTLIGSTKFAPLADSIVHPQYAAQRRDYDQGVADIATREQMQDVASRTEAQALMNRGRALELTEKANQLATDAQTRALTGKLKQFENSTRILQMGGSIQAKDAPVPQGASVIPNPFDDKSVYLIPALPKNVPMTLDGDVAKFAGVKPGTQVSPDIWGKVVDGYSHALGAQQAVQERQTAAAQRSQDAADRLAETQRHNREMESLAGTRAGNRGTTNAQENRQIDGLAQQALNEVQGVNPADPNRIDYAIANVNNYGNYQGHPIGDNREKVVARLLQWKQNALRTQAAENKEQPMFIPGPDGKLMLNPKLSGPQRPVRAPAQTPGVRPQLPAGGGPPPQPGQQPQTGVMPRANAATPARNAAAPVSAPPKQVTDRLAPGVHTFANGQTWVKRADGRMVFVQAGGPVTAPAAQ